MCPAQGQVHREGAAKARLALQGQASTRELGELAVQGQADAAPLVLSRGRVVQLLEALEDALLVLFDPLRRAASRQQ